ncbi:type II toxin-antitoxin system RelE/ParE family toxin [Streptococcus pyogenes]|uniref:type II toxin-antitoxin system RelE/ParE family toxin n=1 Tax=Streptococcus pyogenes TaxID=1314 RepID=UPI0010A1E53D|nr:type II toxin-antitoxin system RelE/ParE family toxin [Streptococcus pyogenes]VGQ50881.1 prophage LambdaSa04, RelE/ParE family protein [Streptococcus pyogenes]VGQ56105.1 prophage LambdaSa04, RelE/ParE family protein [Streptococcus pyogenes]VGV45982.1 prophage LambdaSa04, RelE/ParE family protein [Streptococcus pyogenes]VHA94299.1 prophage LambdaSa04, RelE/ParE family protein [Streptococcus pyogenes]VHA97584.1 prophage LambdaSa04, RelE/ParE family protein [Streptococcus pyogenes]
MKEYQVTMSDDAKADLLSIYHYVRDELCAPQASDNLLERLSQAMLSLSIFPERCAIIEDLIGKGYTFRQLIVKKYRIVYHVLEDEVIIVAVVYGSRHMNNW